MSWLKAILKGPRANPVETGVEDVDEEEYHEAQVIAAAQLVEAQGVPESTEEAAVEQSTTSSSTKKRKVTEIGSSSKPTKISKSAVAEAVAPPHYAFDSRTLGGRPLARDNAPQTFRAVFANAKTIGDMLSSLAALGSWFPITVTPQGMSLKLLDSANVMYCIIDMAKDGFLVFENVRDSSIEIVVSSAAFQTRKSQFTSDLTMTFAFQSVPADAKDLIVQLYPRSGRAKDGTVTRFNIPLSETQHDILPDIEVQCEYQHKIVMSHSLFLSVVSHFKSSMGSVSFTITDHSLDMAGRCDEGSRQIEQISFIDSVDNTDEAIESALKAYPKTCHYTRLQPATAERPAPIVNFRLSLMYMRRAIVSLVGCKYIEVSFGRGYTHFNGEFSPLRLRGVYTNPVNGEKVCDMRLFVSCEIETDN